MSTRRPNNFRRLAARLAAHHRQCDQGRRIVAVVGAGASSAAGLPLGSSAIQIIKEGLNATEQRDFQLELRRLGSVYRLREREFETALLAIGSTSHRAGWLRDKLQSMYSVPTGTLLAYEILAHMLKHRFLDAIINFNFDEILDRAVEGELRRDEHRYITSDGDCPARLADPIDVPLYIKPHGTVSHKSTLRFTREAYFGLPTDIARVLGELLGRRPISLIVLGFSMRSFEFNRILRGAKSGSEIFYMCLPAARPRPDPPLPRRIAAHYVNVPVAGTDPLGRAVRVLWAEINDQFTIRRGPGLTNATLPGYSPRGIDRHRLVARLFAASHPIIHGNRGRARRSLDREVRDLRDRVAVELALSIAKGKGVVNMDALTRDRCGQQFQRLCSRTRDLGRPLLEEYESLHSLGVKLGLVEIGYGRELLRLRSESTGSTYGVLSEGDFKDASARLLKKVRARLSKERKVLLDRNRRLFLAVLNRLFRQKEVEIRVDPSRTFDAVFTNAMPLKTEFALREATEALLGDVRIDLLLVIAETGEWLLETGIKERLKDHKIAMIVADGIHRGGLHQLGRVITKDLYWHQHNRHLTVGVDRHDRPVGAIYFNRRLRSGDIVPLRLDAKDSRVALQVFAAYWAKATGHGGDTWLRESQYDPAKVLRDIRSTLTV